LWLVAMVVVVATYVVTSTMHNEIRDARVSTRVNDHKGRDQRVCLCWCVYRWREWIDVRREVGALLDRVICISGFP
jgi:hypothetical protein